MSNLVYAVLLAELLAALALCFAVSAREPKR